MTDRYPIVTLREGREASVQRLHPWIFSGAISRADGAPQPGQLVQVNSSSGQCLGFGHYSDDSIAVKVLSFGAEFSEREFWSSRFQSAYQLRSQLGLVDDPNTSGFRLVNAEGDGLPGLIVDVYGQTAVVQFNSQGMYDSRDYVISALQEILGGRLVGIFAQTHPGMESEQGTYVWGQGGDPIFRERGLKFEVDWQAGQKTGFFLDQRDNRFLLRSFSSGAKVLNCFSYTGGFSVSALTAGAREVISVDSSKAALEMLERNLLHNGQSNHHQSVQADCLQYLHSIAPDFDVIVLDPPAFIKHRGALRGGIKGYETINYHAVRQLKRGGILFTFSCSQLLLRQDFLELLQRCAVRAGRRLRVLHQLHQAPCHPIQLGHIEGEYLKGFVLEVQ